MGEPARAEEKWLRRISRTSTGQDRARVERIRLINAEDDCRVDGQIGHYGFENGAEARTRPAGIDRIADIGKRRQKRCDFRYGCLIETRQRNPRCAQGIRDKKARARLASDDGNSGLSLGR